MRSVAIIVYDGVQSLDVTGPLEVLAGATRWLEAAEDLRPGYIIRLVSPNGEAIRSSAGLVLGVDGDLDGIAAPLDLLLVAGGSGVDAACEAGLGRRLAAVVARVQPRRIASVCTGALALAHAGLLDGRRATTHWAWCRALADAHPEIDVVPDALYVHDGPVWTSAGVTAGMDLALALVEEDLGRDVALQLARWLVMFLHRPGGQSQFSASLSHQMAVHDGLRAVQSFVIDHPGADCSVAALARRAAMSPRTFARRFKLEVGTTPARFVQGIRVERARRLLERESLGLGEIADRCGFGSSESMRRAFLDRVAVSPAAYRLRFRSPT